VDDRLSDRIVRKWQEAAWRDKQVAEERVKMERKRQVQLGEVTPDRIVALPGSSPSATSPPS